MKLINFIESKTIWFVVLGISSLIYILFVLNFEPRIDDAFLGEQLYWLLHGGHVRSNLMSGFRNIGIENLWTVFHKGTIYYGYFWTWLFGWSIYTLHIGITVASLLFIYLLWRYFREEDHRFAPNAFYIVASVCFLFYYFTWNSSRFRPEILELLLGFFSYFQLEKYLKNGRISHWILAAIASGLAMLTHLNGLIIIAAGFILLLSNKRWKTAFLFGTLATLVFLVTYFADVFINADLNYFLFQFKNDPALDASQFHWYAPFLKIPGEWFRYFHADVDTAFALPFFLVFITTFRYLWKKSKNMVIYLLSMMIIISFYTYNKKSIFMLPYFPYMAILFVEGAVYLIYSSKKSAWKKIVIFFFLIYFPVTIALMGIKIKNLYSSHILKDNVEIGNIIGKNNRVMTDEMFIFPEIKDQSYIVNIEQFRFFRGFHGIKAFNFNQIIEESQRRNIDYLILRFAPYDEYKKDLSESDKRYEIIKENKDYILLKISKNQL
jgi:hypothetical protein